MLPQVVSAAASRPGSDYIVRWLICLLIAAVDAIGLWVIGIRPDEHALISVLVVNAMLLTMGVLFLVAGTRMTVAQPAYAAVAEFLLSFSQMIFFIVAAGITTYLGASLAFPLVDVQLVRFDAFVGLERSVFDLLLVEHPQISRALIFAYGAMFPALLLLLVINAARGYGGNSELIWGFFIITLLTCVVAAIFPAIGFDGMIGHRHVEILEEVRAGAWTALGPNNASGIVTFPSFHAALPVIMAYDARRFKLTAAVVWPLAALIVISTPLCGGHYVADTIAGVSIAVGAITAIRVARSKRRANWISMPGAAVFGGRSNAIAPTESAP